MSSLRRPAGLVAVAGIALSSALLSAGSAHAAPSGWTFETSAPLTVVVPNGTCAVDWTLVGASVDGQPGIERKVTTAVQAGESYWLLPGTAHSSGGDTSVNRNLTNYLVAAASGGPTLVENGGAQVIPNPGRDSSGPAGTTSPTGFISGAGVACDVPSGGTEVPGAPVLGLASPGMGAGEIHVGFDNAPATSDTASVTGHEYSVDGGAWTPVTTWPDYFFDRKITITGLTPGKMHAVRVRAVSAAGPGASSAEKEARAGVVPVGAPTQVSVTTGPSLLTVRWAPPTAAGTYPVDGYRVLVLGVHLKDTISACPVDATVRSCVVPVPAGGTYTVQVNAVDTLGFTGAMASAWSGAVPVPEIPDTVPAKDGDLRGPAGAAIDKVTVGKTVVLKGSGYAPFSTVRAVAYSTPTELGTFVTDANGDFEATVTIPADLPVGNHSLVVTGIDRQGQPRNLRVDVTVAAAAAPAITSARLERTTTRLASTGADVGVPLVGGLCAVVAGSGLRFAARRRAAARA